MPNYTLITAREPARFRELVNQMPRADGPNFLEFDPTVVKYWPLLNETFPDNQYCLVDQETGIAAGFGKSIPLSFDGGWNDLPAEGLDWVLAKGFDDLAAGSTPNLMSALYIEIAETHRSRHLSSRMLAAMKDIARAQGFLHLIAPVRPSLKSRYPLIDIETYLQWQTPEGLPFDPWLRVHIRIGGRQQHACRRAMLVEGTREQWSAWTGMAIPGDGEYVIPYGLVPVSVYGNTGTYIEPGVWVVHEI